jgi:hypothetical protein
MITSDPSDLRYFLRIIRHVRFIIVKVNTFTFQDNNFTFVMKDDKLSFLYIYSHFVLRTPYELNVQYIEQDLNYVYYLSPLRF